MKKRNIKKVGLFLGILPVLLGVVMIFAYFTDANEISNILEIGHNTTEITETFDPPKPGTKTTKKVIIKNEGDVTCYIRVRLTLTDSRYSDDFDYYYNDKKGINTADWTKGDDGWYYYNEKVEVGKTTSPLITHIQLHNDVDLISADSFTIDVFEESVQANGADYAEDAFASVKAN